MTKSTRIVAVVVAAVVCVAGLAAATPIQPDALGGLKLWLKADDIVPGAEPANGAEITLWQDHSGLGNDATPPTDLPPSPFQTPERQERSITNVGLTRIFPVVRYNTADDELLRAPDIINGPDAVAEASESENFSDVTVIAFYQTDALNARVAGFGTSYNDNRGGVNANNLHFATDPSIRKDNGSIGGYTEAHPTDFLIRSATMTAAGGGSITDFFNGEQALDSTANYNVRSDNFYIGDMRVPTGYDFDIGEVIVYNRALTAEERAGIEEYLSAKYVPIPEPATLALFGLGALAAIRRRRRRA